MDYIVCFFRFNGTARTHTQTEQQQHHTILSVSILTSLRRNIHLLYLVSLFYIQVVQLVSLALIPQFTVPNAIIWILKNATKSFGFYELTSNFIDKTHVLTHTHISRTFSLISKRCRNFVHVQKKIETMDPIKLIV